MQKAEEQNWIERKTRQRDTSDGKSFSKLSVGNSRFIPDRRISEEPWQLR